MLRKCLRLTILSVLLVAFVAPFALALVLAFRANAPPGAVAAFTILSAMGIWGGQGLVAGIPLDAVTWLGLGLAATAAAQRTSAAAQEQWRDPAGGPEGLPDADDHHHGGSTQDHRLVLLIEAPPRSW